MVVCAEATFKTGFERNLVKRLWLETTPCLRQPRPSLFSIKIIPVTMVQQGDYTVELVEANSKQHTILALEQLLLFRTLAVSMDTDATVLSAITGGARLKSARGGATFLLAFVFATIHSSFTTLI
jgi:hypothetical protein